MTAHEKEVLQAQARIDIRRAKIKALEADNAQDLRELRMRQRIQAERMGHLPRVPE